jgi:hypothetical protein
MMAAFMPCGPVPEGRVWPEWVPDACHAGGGGWPAQDQPELTGNGLLMVLL